jgi:ketosteroid isomerase-like protein
MSRLEVDVVRRVYEFARDQWVSGPGGDERTVALTQELWDPDVVIEENSAFPDADTYRGYAGLAQWWNAFFEIYEEVRLEPQEFIPRGDRVLVMVRQVLRSKMGVTLAHDVAHLWTIRNGRVVHVTGYSDPADGRSAIGTG